MVDHADQMRRIPVKLKYVACCSVLFVASLISAFAIAELSLRTFYQKHQYAAESKFDTSTTRICVRKKHTHYKRKHPDTDERHVVYYNNLAIPLGGSGGQASQDKEPAPSNNKTPAGFSMELIQ